MPGSPFYDTRLFLTALVKDDGCTTVENSPGRQHLPRSEGWPLCAGRGVVQSTGNQCPVTICSRCS